MGAKGQNSTFSEHGHFVYQIEENQECSKMVANILPANPTHPMTLGVKRSNSTFSEKCHVAYQIKGNHKCISVVVNILPADHLHPWGWGQKVKFHFDDGLTLNPGLAVL